MPEYRHLESKLHDLLGLSRRPVAVAFRETAPEGVEQFAGAVPSGCSFWRLAAEGRTFATVASDHFNCPIGSYTHAIDMPAERQPELMGVLSLMTEIGYVRMEEVPGIPRLAAAPGSLIYGPLADAPVDPDAVLVAGKPKQLMLLVEAAARAGAQSTMPLMARPTCMAIPAAIASGLVTSAGCIGNRVYTDLGDDELYAVIRGSDLGRVVAELETIVAANQKLAEYHTARRKQIATA
jgi:uncharacterized protein (DUF169 family)